MSLPLSAQHHHDLPHYLKASFTFWYLDKHHVQVQQQQQQQQNGGTSSGLHVQTSPLASPASDAVAPQFPDPSSPMLSAAQGGSAAASSQPYEDYVHKIATFNTVEDFWHVYSHLLRPHQFSSNPGLEIASNSSVNFHLFREGIQPMWEDPQNSKGGKWTLRIKKSVSSRLWEDCLLAVIGDAFQLDDEICGVVLSTKNSEDVISVWNRNANNQKALSRIRDTLKRIFDLPSSMPLEYRAHDLSLKNAQMQQQHQQPGLSPSLSPTSPSMAPGSPSSRLPGHSALNMHAQMTSLSLDSYNSSQNVSKS